MRKSKKKVSSKNLLMIFSILLVGVLSLTIVYAALATTLNISGSGSVNAADWSFELKKMENICPSLSGMPDEIKCDDFYIHTDGATLESSGVIDGTSIKDISISLTKPGDGIQIAYEITNTGSVPAVFSSNTYSEGVFQSSTNNESDIELIKNNFGYESMLGILGEKDIYTGDVLCPGESWLVAAGFVLNSDMESVVSSKITISNLGTEFVFTQGDDSLCD